MSTKKKNEETTQVQEEFIMPFIFWNMVTQYRKDEGWDLFDAAGVIQIQREDQKEKFDCDASALNFVTQRALEGSRLHMFALFLDGRDTHKAVYIPRGLRLFNISFEQWKKNG